MVVVSSSSLVVVRFCVKFMLRHYCYDRGFVAYAKLCVARVFCVSLFLCAVFLLLYVVFGALSVLVVFVC